MSKQSSESIGSTRLNILSFLFFLSGTTGLILQVVWMYRLGLVFGNAAYATAATLAAFFFGIAIGGWYWGNTSTHFKRPLRVYGFMELGIALTALLWIPGIEFYQSHYASAVSLFGGNQTVLTLMKFIFSTTLLLLPTVLMGGTFPILAQYVGKGQNKLASRGTVLYTVNTLGASVGVFIAGFFLISAYGVSSTYALAISLAMSIGVAAIILDWLPQKKKATKINKTEFTETTSSEKIISSTLTTGLSYPQFITIAFASGLLALSAETIWTKMFAQVLQNSVYSFSAILVVFLIALGFGGLLSHILVRLSLAVVPVLLILLSISAVLVGFSPTVFNLATNGLDYLADNTSWLNYLGSIFKLSFLVVFPPTVLLGAIFPFLLKTAPTYTLEPGKFVGKLVLFNSIGGTIGPILAGFVMLDTIGLWNSIKVVAILYGVVALFIAFSFFDKKNLRWMILPVLCVLGVAALTNPPIVKLDSRQKLLDMWQSSDGVITIVETEKNIQMRLDNFYVLGDSHSTLVEQMQAHVPLLIHPEPSRTLFLGMGTGITAGAALNHNVDQVVVVELVSNVVPAAKRYFSPWTNGLFKDDRAEIITDDARNFLLGTSQQFDVIIGDLFTPWHAGTGSLYTVEHFQQAKNKLAPNGLFAQWLPLYQLTPESFEVIAATFATVFPQVTLWRADFSSSGASIALIGQDKGTQLSQKVLQQNITNIVGERDTTLSATEHMAGLFYLGNLTALQDSLSDVMINTDDRRSVEFKAPILSQQVSVGNETFIEGEELEFLLTKLAKNIPASEDPYLSNLPTNELKYIEVGLLYFRYQHLVSSHNQNEANILLDKINQIAPDFLKKPESPKTSESNQ